MASRGQPSRRQRCPGKGGAKRLAGAYASDFYAGLVMPPWAKRGPQYQVADTDDSQAATARRGGTALFTPPPKCTVARCREQRPRLPCLWICATHQHRQCASCAVVGRGVRHCCARWHAGHPWLHAALPGLHSGVRRAAARILETGGTPSAKRHTKQRAQPLGPVREQPHKRGRVAPAPPPPPRPRGHAHSRRAPHITPKPQRLWLRRGRLSQPEQAPETGYQAVRTALVF